MQTPENLKIVISSVSANSDICLTLYHFRLFDFAVERGEGGVCVKPSISENVVQPVIGRERAVL